MPQTGIGQEKKKPETFSEEEEGKMADFWPSATALMDERDGGSSVMNWFTTKRPAN